MESGGNAKAAIQFIPQSSATLSTPEAYRSQEYTSANNGEDHHYEASYSVCTRCGRLLRKDLRRKYKLSPSKIDCTLKSWELIQCSYPVPKLAGRVLKRSLAGFSCVSLTIDVVFAWTDHPSVKHILECDYTPTASYICIPICVICCQKSPTQRGR